MGHTPGEGKYRSLERRAIESDVLQNDCGETRLDWIYVT